MFSRDWFNAPYPTSTPQNSWKSPYFEVCLRVSALITAGAGAECRYNTFGDRMSYSLVRNRGSIHSIVHFHGTWSYARSSLQSWSLYPIPFNHIMTLIWVFSSKGHLWFIAPKSACEHKQKFYSIWYCIFVFWYFVADFGAMNHRCPFEENTQRKVMIEFVGIG